MGQQPTCEAGFLRSEKTGAQNNPLHIGRGLWTPLWPGAVGRENRGQYSLEHGAAVIPPLYIVAWAMEKQMSSPKYRNS